MSYHSWHQTLYQEPGYEATNMLSCLCISYVLYIIEKEHRVMQYISKPLALLLFVLKGRRRSRQCVHRDSSVWIVPKSCQHRAIFKLIMIKKNLSLNHKSVLCYVTAAWMSLSIDRRPPERFMWLTLLGHFMFPLRREECDDCPVNMWCHFIINYSYMHA